MNSLSDETDEEDEDSSAWLKEAANDPYVCKVVKQLMEESIRRDLPMELPCFIRELFRDGSWHAPKKAILSINRKLYYGRITNLLRKTIRSGLNIAVRRKILQRHRGGYLIYHRRFADYDEAFLEIHLLRVTGRTWVKRSEVAMLFARHLGFKITTPTIKQTTERLISRIIRAGRLEKSGRNLIRRV